MGEREFLGLNFQLAHAVWLKEQEIELEAESKAVPVHNPFSNMFYGSGVSPVLQMLEAGISIAIGTDGQACINGQEMMDTLKWLVNLYQLNSLDAIVLPPEQVIQVACRNGAYAFGIQRKLAVLNQGRKPR